MVLESNEGPAYRCDSVKDRFLFLDFDGVLHPFGCTAEALFCRLPLIHRVLEQNAGLRVVVHSSWREVHSPAELKDLLFHTRPDLASRFKGTTDPKVAGRWESIEAWLKTHQPSGRVCVLDDEPRMFPSHVVRNQDSRVHFVECPAHQGLSETSFAWGKLREWIYSPFERSTP